MASASEHNRRYREKVKADPVRLAAQRTYMKAYRERPENKQRKRVLTNALHARDPSKHRARLQRYRGGARGRSKMLKYFYKLTEQQYADMLAAQDGKCAACAATVPGHGKKHFSVDHDHSCCPG